MKENEIQEYLELNRDTGLVLFREMRCVIIALARLSISPHFVEVGSVVKVQICGAALIYKYSRNAFRMRMTVAIAVC